MKKVLCLILLVLLFSFVSAEPMDLVVLLDVSTSMLPYFDDAASYLIREILTEHLSSSDGFHLLSFAGDSEIELTLDLGTYTGVESAMDRIMLLQPLGKFTDLVSALGFVYNYTSLLRQDSDKKILVLTDGIHDPPPESVYQVAGGDYREAAANIVSDIQNEGWEIILVQFPVASVRGDGSSEMPSIGIADETEATDREAGQFGTDTVVGGENSMEGGEAESDETESTAVDLYSDLSEDLGIETLKYSGADEDLAHQVLGAPELIFPEDLGEVGHRFVLPLTIKNSGKEMVVLELSEIIWNGIDILSKPVKKRVPPSTSRILNARVVLPSSTEPGSIALSLTADFSDDHRAYPRSGTTAIVLRPGRTQDGTRSLNVLPVLGYLAAAVGGLLILTFVVLLVRSLISNRLRSNLVRGRSGVTRGSRGVSGDRSIEMYVDGQNPNIGTRNVHEIREGGTKSVGGGRSSFLIYLYPFPMRTARISRKGDRYTFTPLRNSYCEGDTALVDCLDTDIYLISDHKRQVRVRFSRYVSALEKINRIMRLVNEPGPRRDL